MSEKIYAVPSAWADRAFVDADYYAAMYKQSVENPEGFWSEHGKRIHWFEPYTRVKNTSFGAGAGLHQVVRGWRHQRRL